jgi:Zn-finger nucleic acid-binding protein
MKMDDAPHCPRCSIPLAPQTGALGESVCMKCHGRFLDQSLTQKVVVEGFNLDSAMLQEIAQGFAGQRLSCPGCRAKMSPIGLRSVPLDICFSCGGLWCDSGELSALTDGNVAEHKVPAVPPGTPMEFTESGWTRFVLPATPIQVEFPTPTTSLSIHGDAATFIAAVGPVIFSVSRSLQPNGDPKWGFEYGKGYMERPFRHVQNTEDYEEYRVGEEPARALMVRWGVLHPFPVFVAATVQSLGGKPLTEEAIAPWRAGIARFFRGVRPHPRIRDLEKIFTLPEIAVVVDGDVLDSSVQEHEARTGQPASLEDAKLIPTPDNQGRLRAYTQARGIQVLPMPTAMMLNFFAEYPDLKGLVVNGGTDQELAFSRDEIRDGINIFFAKSPRGFG